MLSANLTVRLSELKAALQRADTNPQFAFQKRDANFNSAFSRARADAFRWLAEVELAREKLDDDAVRPLVPFTEGLIRVIEGNQGVSGGPLNEVLRLETQFKSSPPVLIYDLLASLGVTRLSDEDFLSARKGALEAIRIGADDARTSVLKDAEGQRGNFAAEVSDATARIQDVVKDARDELDRIKSEQSKISVEKAQQQFNEAAKSLRLKAWCWGVSTGALFVALIGLLIWFFHYPPLIISQIQDSWKPGGSAAAPAVSVPLLLAASAYFTSIRLALIGILGVGLALGVKMTRAYLHMIEHNQHKLRVTNSIEAFVAAFWTPEQKGVVLGKLVESVTEFGDSGILGNQNDGASLPSVIVSAVTKGGGKAE